MPEIFKDLPTPITFNRIKTLVIIMQNIKCRITATNYTVGNLTRNFETWKNWHKLRLGLPFVPCRPWHPDDGAVRQWRGRRLGEHRLRRNRLCTYRSRCQRQERQLHRHTFWRFVKNNLNFFTQKWKRSNSLLIVENLAIQLNGSKLEN